MHFNPKKRTPKTVYKEPTYTFFYDTQNLNLKKKIFRNLISQKIWMPKKMTPKSQAKNKTPISIIPIFSYFLTLKKHHANKYNY